MKYFKSIIYIIIYLGINPNKESKGLEIYIDLLKEFNKF